MLCFNKNKMGGLLLTTILLVILTGNNGQTDYYDDYEDLVPLLKEKWHYWGEADLVLRQNLLLQKKVRDCERESELEILKDTCSCSSEETSPTTRRASPFPHHDCKEWLYEGYTTDGVYPIIVNDRTVPVSCDMEQGGWIVIQKQTAHTWDYNRDMVDYAEGFGDVAGKHWLGLNTVHQLTETGNWTLRIDLESFENETAWAEYSDFQVTASPDFKLLFNKTSYRGTAGDGGRGLSHHHGMKFTTLDVDQDNWNGDNCAYFSNGGFWYDGARNCAYVLTTGMPYQAYSQIVWHPWKGYTPLESVTLRIKKNEP